MWLLAARVSRKVLGGKKGSETSQYASVVDPGLWRSSQHCSFSGSLLPDVA